MGAILLDGALLGAVWLAVMSAVSLVRKKYPKGVICGVSSTVSCMLFAWMWYGSFVQLSGRTWVEIAFRPGSAAYKQNMAFLACGAGLAAANVIGIVWKRIFNKSAGNSAGNDEN